MESLVTDGSEPSAAEIESWNRADSFLSLEEATPDEFPSLDNMSAGFTYKRVIRPLSPKRPDYVAVEMETAAKYRVDVIQWNSLWEAGQFRRRFFDVDDVSEPIKRIAELGDVNAIFVPRTESRYFEYAPLYHLLPRETLLRFGLPILRAGHWPFLADWVNLDRYLPRDFAERLSRAWASTVWPHLNSGSKISAFSSNDPIRLLAHNLDFWIPPVTSVIEDQLRTFPEVDEGIVPGPVPLDDGTFLEGALSGSPRMGGDVWRGEYEAFEKVSETVRAADETGKLRGIIDAVRSNRVEDDFSPQWSNAREDFERKLHHKRNKVKVRFVELRDTIPVQSSESQLVDNLVTNDFLALLDNKQRRIVVLLSSGYRQHEIAEKLGYANHSAISKNLARIREQAAKYFDIQ